MTALYALLCSITMFFLAFTSAMIVRRGLGGDWTGMPVPTLLWVNTLVLMASSAALQFGSRAAAGVLGAAFLAGQIAIWRDLPVASAIGNSFYWIFTAAHAAHVLGGLFALRFARPELARLYWHFLAGLWLYLLLLFVWWGRA